MFIQNEKVSHEEPLILTSYYFNFLKEKNCELNITNTFYLNIGIISLTVQNQFFLKIALLQYYFSFYYDYLS